MKNFKKINRIILMLQIFTAAVLTFMMFKAMKTLMLLMKGQGYF